jgi:hypothetical protein
MSHPLQGKAATRIEELFVLSAEEAQVAAAELLAAIDSRSGDSSSWSIVEERIEKELGARLPWRSRNAKAAAEKRRSDQVAGYSEYLNKKRGPFEREW